jgi:membrane associated rhomboid family serine protease
MSVSSRHSNNNLLLGQDNNALTWLIILNTVFFVMIAFIKIIYFFSDLTDDQFNQQIFNWFSLPAKPMVALTRPWTFFTNMFTHVGVWHLLSSMLWLYAFGYILQDLSGNKRIAPLYLYGGVLGGICFILANSLIPGLKDQPHAPLFGAGAAIMSMAIATATLSPNYRIFPMLGGGIPVWILTVIFVAIDYATIASANLATGIAHIAAAIIGFVFIKQLQAGNDMGQWMFNVANWCNDLFNPEKKHTSSKRVRHYYKATQPPYAKKPHLTQQRLDEILDKINQKGYEKLSEEEKEFLRKMSNENI